MVKEQKFFVCKECGELVGVIDNEGSKLFCGKDPMVELKPNTIDASKEKHVPQVTIFGNTVTVKIGSVLHPMLKEHHIDWVYLQADNGGQRKNIKNNSEATVVFELAKGEKAVKVFAYCNLHGLWSADVNG